MNNEFTKEEVINMELDCPPDERADERENIKLVETISEFYPAELVYLFKTEDGKQIFDRTEARLIHPTLRIRISFSNRDKQYKFNCLDFFRLKNMTYHSVNEASKELTQPQGVGKLTPTKILAWVNYFEQHYKRAQAMNNENAAKIQAFRDSIKDLPVRWNGKEQKSGEIEINGIRLKFTIDPTYVSQHIELDSYLIDNTVKDFLALSDNKFTPTRKHSYQY